MRYVSTRGTAPVLGFADVLLAGLAEDGGLYVPEAWPMLSPAEWRGLRGLAYPELTARILGPFVGDAIDERTLARLCREAYRGFAHAAVAPLVQLEHRVFALELFHGPTLAFKDFALQLLGHFPAAAAATDSEVLALIEAAGLGGRGVGWVDAHLLASVRLSPQASLWTRDRRLRTAADACGVPLNR